MKGKFIKTSFNKKNWVCECVGVTLNNALLSSFFFQIVSTLDDSSKIISSFSLKIKYGENVGH